jgi:dihydrofolate synthase/folylpolyglutamate synthase
MERISPTYPDTLDFLYHKLPMFSRLGMGAFKKDLTNIRKLCQALGNPQEQFKSVHVAGTNGKGSVSYMLAAVLQVAGYRTGLYTSPHLFDFRERIKINGDTVSQDFVVRFIQDHFALIGDVKPSFFEITVAMAFQWFAESQVDIAVIETGLGGRLDSTNIITPELSVITNISYDHQQMLGDTLAEIAGEKAGIIKPGIPVVIGETAEATRAVFTGKAAQTHSPIVFADQVRQIVSEELAGSERHVTVRMPGVEEGGTTRYTLDLTGAYQAKNLLTVLGTVDVLKQFDWNISDEMLSTALASVKERTGLRGRWDIIAYDPLVVVDVAHNEGGIREVMHQVQTLPIHRLHIVTGFVKDKTLDPILSLFPRKALYYFCQADIPRALSADELARQAAGYGLRGETYSTPMAAFEAAKQAASANDMILVCGSVFIAAEILEPD